MYIHYLKSNTHAVKIDFYGMGVYFLHSVKSLLRFFFYADSAAKQFGIRKTCFTPERFYGA